MHPECPPEALALADMVGSTAAIIEYIGKESGEIIVATERGVTDKLSLRYPGRLHQLGEEADGSCRLTCPDMKLTTAEAVLAALRGLGGEEIELEPTLLAAARRSLDNMLTYGG